jgi:hypothetical protein
MAVFGAGPDRADDVEPLVEHRGADGGGGRFTEPAEVARLVRASADAENEPAP